MRCEKSERPKLLYLFVLSSCILVRPCVGTIRHLNEVKHSCIYPFLFEKQKVSTFNWRQEYLVGRTWGLASNIVNADEDS